MLISGLDVAKRTRRIRRVTIAVRRKEAEPWRDVETPLEEINTTSAMISVDESRFLHWLTSEFYKGEGEIIDAGCLLGGSTHALASGLARNEACIEKRKCIYSFDIFTYFPDYDNNILREVSHTFVQMKCSTSSPY